MRESGKGVGNGKGNYARRFLGAPEVKNSQLASSKSFLIMLYGAPSSGKTTFADKFSTEYKTPFVNLGRILDSFEKLAASIEEVKPVAKPEAKKAAKVAAAPVAAPVAKALEPVAEKPSEPKLDFSQYGLNDDFDFSLFDPAPNLEPTAPATPVAAPAPAPDFTLAEKPVSAQKASKTAVDYQHDRERTLIKETALAVVTGMLESKQTILLEGGIDTKAERDYLREVATMAGYQPLLLWVQTDMATLKQRLLHAPKADRLTKKQFENAVARLEAPSANEQPIVISGKHTFDTQIRTVLGQLVRVS